MRQPPKGRKMEEMGMTDAQFKDHLREVIAYLERVKELDSLEKVRKELDEFIERKQKTLED